MELTYKNEKLRNLCENPKYNKELIKKYGIEVAKRLRNKNNCDLVVANDLATIKNGEHIGYIIDKNNEVEEAHGKDDIAKKLVRRINYGK